MESISEKKKETKKETKKEKKKKKTKGEEEKEEINMKGDHTHDEQTEKNYVKSNEKKEKESKKKKKKEPKDKNKKVEKKRKKDDVNDEMKVDKKKKVETDTKIEEKKEKRDGETSAESDVDDDNSSSSDEDHDGLLLTSKFKKKFSTLLYKLKNKDKQLFDKQENFFHESDFETDLSETDKNENEKNNSEEDSPKNNNSKEKFVNYSSFYHDVLLKEGAEIFEKEEEELLKEENKKKDKNYYEEQAELKRKFLEACDEAMGTMPTKEKKIKSIKDRKKEIEEDNFFTIKEKTEGEKLEEEKNYSEFLIQSKIQKDEENELLKEFWKENLSKEEEFLRDYIMKEMWKEDQVYYPEDFAQVDEIDEEYLEKAEEFERSYNFRFEETDGKVISTIPRNIEKSVRIDAKKQKKKEKRKEKKKKEKEQKRKMLMESIKPSKKLKTGSHEECEEEHIKKIIDEPKDKKKSFPLKDNNRYYWYICDLCNKTLKPLDYVFECDTCDNFALCKKCFKKQGHEHKLIKILIPHSCEPPKSKESYSKDKASSEAFEYLEYDSSAYEDLIDDMPIRFKYIQVKPKSFNMTTDFILKTDEKTLNKMVPIKHTSAYYNNHSILNNKKVQYEENMRNQEETEE